MGIIISRAVGVDDIANRPGATTNGRLFADNATGTDTTYAMWVDDGANWQPVRSNTPVTIYGSTGVSVAWTLVAGAGESFGGGNQINRHKINFERFRQGRIWVVASNRLVSAAAVDFKIVDITNTQDITGTVSFPKDAAWYGLSSTWAALNAATYAGDAEFEMQCAAGSGGDVIDFGTIMLELR
jgi:hypothetical protein